MQAHQIEDSMQVQPEVSISSDKQQDESKLEKAKEPKMNSVSIAKELILGHQNNYAHMLFQYKQIKNQNYQNFTKRIIENLKKNQIQFSKSCEIFLKINSAATKDNTTHHQMMTILLGFIEHWKHCTFEVSQFDILIKNLGNIFDSIIKKYISFCGSTIELKFKQCLREYQDEVLSMINEKNGKGGKSYSDECYRKLALIYEFELFDRVEAEKIINFLLEFSNTKDIDYVFTKKNGVLRRQLVNLYVEKVVRNEDLKKAETIIKAFKINPYQFPFMIDKMIKKYLIYQIRTYKLYFIELSICHDRKYLQSLTKLLKSEGKITEALHFINKYDLASEDFGLRVEAMKDKGVMANVLIKNDGFGPTEEIALKQHGKKYLTLQYFKYKEEDVRFIYAKNISTFDYEEAFKDEDIGIDSQSVGGTHVFDPIVLALIQVCTNQKIYLFDAITLQNNEKFKEIMVFIFRNCKVYGHDFIKQIHNIAKELQLQKIIKEEEKQYRIVDTNKLFKTLYPKEQKSSLAFLCEFLLTVPLSKYQQCSGWRARPLRKTQRHYAALDAVLPLKLGKIMETIQKGNIIKETQSKRPQLSS